MGCKLLACLPPACIGMNGSPPIDLYAINYDDIVSIEYNAEGAIKNITLKAGTKAFQLNNIPQTGSQMAEFNFSPPNRWWKSTITFGSSLMSQKYRNVYEELAFGNFLVLGKGTDQNDAISPVNKENRLFAYGSVVPLHQETGTAGYGAKPEDPSGVVFALVTDEPKLPPEVVPDSTIYTSNNPIKQFLDTLQNFDYCT